MRIHGTLLVTFSRLPHSLQPQKPQLIQIQARYVLSVTFCSVTFWALRSERYVLLSYVLSATFCSVTFWTLRSAQSRSAQSQSCWNLKLLTDYAKPTWAFSKMKRSMYSRLKSLQTLNRLKFFKASTSFSYLRYLNCSSNSSAVGLNHKLSQYTVIFQVHEESSYALPKNAYVRSSVNQRNLQTFSIYTPPPRRISSKTPIIIVDVKKFL